MKFNVKNYVVLTLSSILVLFNIACQETKFDSVKTETILTDTSGKESNVIQQDNSSEKERYRKNKDEIEDFVKSRDLNRLILAIDDLPQRWQRSVIGYALLSDVCSALNSYDFGDEKQYLYARKCAKQVIKNADNIPLGLELKMIENLQGVEEYTSGLIAKEKWNYDRSERIGFLLDFWKRVQNGIDREYDINALENRPTGSVPVPAPNYMPGMRPEDIKEPEVRARYEQAIKANQLKIQKRNLQIELQRLDKRLPDYVESFLIQMYSIPPYNIEMLKKDISNFNLTNERAERILKTVNTEVQKSQTLKHFL